MASSFSLSTLGMLKSAMTEEAGDSLNVSSVIEDVHGKAETWKNRSMLLHLG